jgi:hypothetical protein
LENWHQIRRDAAANEKGPIRPERPGLSCDAVRLFESDATNQFDGVFFAM